MFSVMGKRAIKYLVVLSILISAFLFMLPGQSFATVRITINNDRVELRHGVQPEFQGKILMLPLRDTFVALGARVGFVAESATATVAIGELRAEIPLRGEGFSINGKRLTMDRRVIIRNNRALIPAHVVEQIFGVALRHDNGELYISRVNKQPFRVATLNGPTGIAMAQLSKDSYLGENAEMSYEILANPQLLPAKLLKGEVDIAFLPVNMAATLYNRSKGEIAMVSTNMWGLLSLVSTDPEVLDWSDLKGRQIDIFGHGATPEVAFRALLEANGLNPATDVTYNFAYDTAATLATAIAANQLKDGVAVIAEPFTSIALSRNPQARVVASFKDEWTEAFEGRGLPINVVVVRREFLEAHPGLVRSFLREFREDIAFMNRNPGEVAGLVSSMPEFNFPKGIIEAAIPRSGYRFETAVMSRNAVHRYLQILLDFNPQTIGGALPGDDFYADVFTDE